MRGEFRLIPAMTQSPSRTTPPFRSFRHDDGEVVRALVAGVLAEHGLPFDLDRFDADLVDIDAAYTNRGGTFLVVEDDTGRVIGCGGLYPLGPSVAEVRKMYLLPEARGQGLGGRLLTELIAAARERGYRTLTLTTSSHLPAAAPLYRRFGFTDVAPDHPSERADGAMRLALGTEPGTEPGRPTR